jgi:4-alpha-glucanotransferase
MLKRSAGILIPLFSIRTENDLGCGEILELSAMMDFALAIGHRCIQLLPLNETAPGESSPYSALSVFAIDPIYISIGALKGVAASSIDCARALTRRGPAVARLKLRAAKLELLDQAFAWFQSNGGAAERAEFESFGERNAGWLRDYALFRALKEKFKFESWLTWPEELRRRDSAALHQARREFGTSIAKFTYLQFLANRQWLAMRQEAARRGAMIGGDLAFGPALDSAEVWAHQELFDLARTIGTPPDAFAAKGQRWGLPMPNWEEMPHEVIRWWRMRARHAAELYDLFRIDHVVGLYRTFSFGPDPDEPGAFFPPGEDAQREQGEEAVRAIKDEAGLSAVIAEDLGSVPPWVKASLSALGVPGYKVLRWEKEGWESPDQAFTPPSSYPELSLATTGTHDTETLATWWREAPERDRRLIADALRIPPPFDPGRPRLRGRVLDAILQALYDSPSILVIVPIQDLFGWSARINLPGTINPRNWNYRLPFNLRPLDARPAVRARIERLRAVAIRSGRFDTK